MSQGFHPNIPVTVVPTSLPPNGAASGDLGGNYPAPIVDGLQGRAVAATAPTERQTLQWNNTAAQWQPRYNGVRVVTATGALTLADDKIIVNNAAANITLTLPAPATAVGKCISFSRAPGSTGTITLATPAGQIQNLNGTVGATTTIGLHSAAGLGVGHDFWSNGINWYR